MSYETYKGLKRVLGGSSGEGGQNLDANFTAIADALESSVIPPGTIIMFAAIEAPAGGWLPCDGTRKNIADYPALGYQLAGLYGSYEEGTFVLPNFDGRFPRDGGVGAGEAQETVLVPSVVESGGTSVVSRVGYVLVNFYIKT